MNTRQQVMTNASDATKKLDSYLQHMESGRTDEAEDALKDVHGILQDSANRMKLGNDHAAMRMLQQAGNSFERQSVGMKHDKPMHLSDAHYALKDAHRSLVDHALRLKKNNDTMNELHGGRLGGLISMLKMDVEKMIKKVGDQYYVYTKDGSRKLGGPFDDREKAFKMLAAVEANKHLTAKHLVASEIKMGKANVEEAPLPAGNNMVHRNVLALHGFQDSPEYQLDGDSARRYLNPSNNSEALTADNMTTFTFRGGKNSKTVVKGGPFRTAAALNMALTKAAKKLGVKPPKPSQGKDVKPGFAGTMMRGSGVKGGKK